jgi:two-component system LytT family response regulator
MIRTLLVDDEPLARAGLRALLSGEPDIEVVGEACDGPEAVARILEDVPDLVLLDVQMPGMDGIEVVRRVSEAHLPAIIFVSAYDRFAIDAFEVHALDYLLKPPSSPRLRAALDRVRTERAQAERSSAEAIAALLEGRGRGSESAAPLHRLVIRDRDRTYLLRDDEVDWCSSAGNYVEVHARGRSHLLRATLTDLERQLDASRFRRIHRTTLVNIDRVREIHSDPSGDSDVLLDTGAVLRMSRRYRDQLLPRS